MQEPDLFCFDFRDRFQLKWKKAVVAHWHVVTSLIFVKTKGGLYTSVESARGIAWNMVPTPTGHPVSAQPQGDADVPKIWMTLQTVLRTHVSWGGETEFCDKVISEPLAPPSWASKTLTT